MVKQNEGGAVLQTSTLDQEGLAETENRGKSLHTIGGKQIVELGGQFFISLTEAMRIISPQSSSVARWFTLHRSLFEWGSDYVYSDEWYPGKKGRVWITLPEGIQTLVQACTEAKRLRIPGGAEERIASFLHLALPNEGGGVLQKETPAQEDGESKKARKQESELALLGGSDDDLEIEFMDKDVPTTDEEPQVETPTFKGESKKARKQESELALSGGYDLDSEFETKEPDVPKTNDFFFNNYCFKKDKEEAAKTQPLTFKEASSRPLIVKRPTLEDVSKTKLEQTPTDAPEGLRLSEIWNDIQPKLVECVSEFARQYHQNSVAIETIMNEAPNEIAEFMEGAEKIFREKMVMRHIGMIRDMISGIISTETQ